MSARDLEKRREIIKTREGIHSLEIAAGKRKHAEKTSKWKDNLKAQYEEVVHQAFPATDHTELFKKRSFIGGWPAFRKDGSVVTP